MASSISYFEKRLASVTSLFEAHRLKREYAKFITELSKRNRLDEVQFSTIESQINSVIEKYDEEIVARELLRYSSEIS